MAVQAAPHLTISMACCHTLPMCRPQGGAALGELSEGWDPTSRAREQRPPIPWRTQRRTDRPRLVQSPVHSARPKDSRGSGHLLSLFRSLKVGEPENLMDEPERGISSRPRASTRGYARIRAELAACFICEPDSHDKHTK